MLQYNQTISLWYHNKGAQVIEQRQDETCYFQFNHLSQFPELIQGVFTRLGGYSQAPYQSLNVAFSSGDDADNVLRNRLLALEALDVQTYPCATLWLVHGADVATLDSVPWEWRFDRPQLSYSPEQRAAFLATKPRWKADAIITKKRGVALALASADCVPLMFYDPVQGALGMAHAGWRGTARGIALATVDAMSEQFGCLPSNIYVGLGPSIGSCCYEVDEHVRDLFQGRAQFDDMPTTQKYRNLVRESVVFSMQQQSLRLDLWYTNRNQLLMAGLLPEHIELPGICTACDTNRFFSHRGEHGKTGRFPGILALRDP